MSAAMVPAIDVNKLNTFIGQFVTDLGAAVHAGMVVLGEKLGLYKALAGPPKTAAELAAETKTDERYVREWLSSQAAGGYVTYDQQTGKFGLTQEQTLTLATPDSPAYLPGAFELALGSLAAVPRIAESFRTGAGMNWHEHVDEVGPARELRQDPLDDEDFLEALDPVALRLEDLRHAALPEPLEKAIASKRSIHAKNPERTLTPTLNRREL